MSKVVNFGDYVSALCYTLPDLYRQENIELKCSVDSFQVELDEATALGIVITELVSNAYIHAFPDGAGEISVTLRATPGGTSLTIADNGVGFIEVETKRRGMGLVKRLVQQVGGTLSLRSDHGSAWTIGLDSNAAAPLAA